jgi:hypothetical protein
MNTNKKGSDRWSVRRIRELAALDLELRTRPKKASDELFWGLVCAVTAAVFWSQQTGSGSSTAAFWAVVFAIVAFGFIVLGAATLIDVRLARRRYPEAASVARWQDDAGHHVLVMVLDGGPQLNRDSPISGSDAMDTAVSVGTFGGGHPLLALGALAFSGLINGVAALTGAASSASRQAELTRQYETAARARLELLSKRYQSEKPSPRRTTMIELTNFAMKRVAPRVNNVAAVRPATVSLVKVPA